MDDPIKIGYVYVHRILKTAKEIGSACKDMQTRMVCKNEKLKNILLLSSMIFMLLSIRKYLSYLDL